MVNNFSMGFNLKSPTTYTPRRKVCLGCAVIDRYPAFFKQPSGFTVALYCTIFTRDLSACKMTALSTSFSIFRSLPLSLSLSCFFFHFAFSSAAVPRAPVFVILLKQIISRLTDGADTGAKRFIKMQAYNFSLDGLSRGFWTSCRVPAAHRTNRDSVLLVQSVPEDCTDTSVYFWIVWTLNSNRIFHSLCERAEIKDL